MQAGFFAFGDVDNDGDQDCFAGLDIALGPRPADPAAPERRHRALHEEGGLRRRARGTAVAANAVFADFNGDGKLDLFVGNGSHDVRGPDQLFFGNGDGTFNEVVANLQDRAIASQSNGVVACDYDNDGDLDIFVSHLRRQHPAAGATALGERRQRQLHRRRARRAVRRLATGNYFLLEHRQGHDPEPGDPRPVRGLQRLRHRLRRTSTATA